LIQFDIASAVPAGSVITSVSLTMWDVRGLNGAQQTDLHRVTAGWGQGTSFFNGGVGGPATTGDATWFSRFYDSSGGPQWTNPGGDFDSAISGSTIVYTHATDVETPFTWSSAVAGNGLMIADVQSWLDDPTKNFGWLIQGNESQGQTAKRFRSGDPATDAQFRPTLTIGFQAVAVPEPGSIALVALGGLAVLSDRLRRRGREAGA
jgi:hypothetical protein